MRSALKRLFNKCLGFTITEMLIGLCLGALLTASVIHIFLSIKQTTIYQQGLSRIQENMQASSILLGRWFRGAGDYGCNRLDEQMTLHWIGSETADIDFNRQHSVYPTTIEQLSRNPKISSSTIARIKKNSDIIVVQRIHQLHRLHDYVDGYNAKISVLGQPSYKKDDIIFLADCQNIDVLKIAKDVIINPQSATTDIYIHIRDNQQTLSKVYPPNAFVGKLESELIYIGQTIRRNQKGMPIFALYATDLNGRTLELVEGVEEMNLEFCCAPETTEYYSQDKWTEKQKIKSVRVNLLLNSVEEVQREATVYKNKDVYITPNDKLMRKWWTEEWVIRSAA